MRATFLNDEHLDRKVHGAATVVWFLLAIPAVLLWRNSVPFLVFVSVYANFVGHWSSYQAAKAETNIEEAVESGGGDADAIAGSGEPGRSSAPPADEVHDQQNDHNQQDE